MFSQGTFGHADEDTIVVQTHVECSFGHDFTVLDHHHGQLCAVDLDEIGVSNACPCLFGFDHAHIDLGGDLTGHLFVGMSRWTSCHASYPASGSDSTKNVGV